MDDQNSIVMHTNVMRYSALSAIHQNDFAKDFEPANGSEIETEIALEVETEIETGIEFDHEIGNAVNSEQRKQTTAMRDLKNYLEKMLQTQTQTLHDKNHHCCEY
jgi:hypothetical protein